MQKMSHIKLIHPIVYGVYTQENRRLDTGEWTIAVA